MEVIRLMGDCDNKCVFCMVEDEIRHSTHKPLDEVLAQIKVFVPGTKVDLFGGEPTIYPHFRQLLHYLHDAHVPYQIATHGRTFADKEFTAFVGRMTPERIRTSLYGAHPRTHDALTRVQGSWTQTIYGISNILEARLDCSVNYVMFRKNVSETLDATRLLYSAGIRTFKFSLPIFTSAFLPLLADLTAVRHELNEALTFLDAQGDARIEIEKAPFCIAPNHISRFCMESYDGMIKTLPSLYDQEEACGTCALRNYCHGVEVGYLRRYGTLGITPLRMGDLPARIVSRMSSETLLRFEPDSPFTLVSLSDPESCIDPEFIAAFMRRAAHLRRRGRLIGML